MVGIYKITNQINGKSYIGKSINIEDRWMRHRSRAFQKNDTQYDSCLYRAIRKYQLCNFTFEVIDECSIEELDEKEIFYIDFYDTFYTNNGYNMTRGGDGGLKKDYTEVCELWNAGYAIGDIAKKINGTRNTVKHILKACQTDYSEEEARVRGKKKKSYSINQYELDGTFIKTWDSSKQIERELHIDHSGIIDCCNWVRRTAGGYKWKYAERSETAAMADLLD